MRLFDGGVRGNGLGEAVYCVFPALLLKGDAAEKIMRGRILGVVAQDGFDLFRGTDEVAAAQENINEFRA
jgi:hypothetical protein